MKLANRAARALSRDRVQKGPKVRVLVGYQVEVLRTQNMGVVIEVVSVWEVTKQSPLRRISRRRCFGVKTDAQRFDPIKANERRC